MGFFIDSLLYIVYSKSLSKTKDISKVIKSNSNIAVPIRRHCLLDSFCQHDDKLPVVHL